MTCSLRGAMLSIPALTGLVSGSAGAQSVTHAPDPAIPAIDMATDDTLPVEERITVEGHAFNVLKQPLGISRLPNDVLHTPQQINVVPQALIRQQNITTVDQALRDVPGVTASIGEGASGMAGDQFLIRGFTAQNDLYEDGLRDFGVYTRDSFDLESVDVIKGPSSEVFGNGTTGGAINMTTRSPRLTNHAEAGFTGGSANFHRGTFDFNQRLDASTALRIEGMGTEADTVGRNFIYSHRWGIAPSIAFGLGRRSTLILQYVHQSENSIPDYGTPLILGPGTHVYRPVTEYGVDRANFYGMDIDQNATSDNKQTARFSYRLTPHITLSDDLRGEAFFRQFAASKIVCDATCTANFFGPHPERALVARSGADTGGAGNGASGGSTKQPLPYDQRSWSVQNVASLVAEFSTFHLHHQLISGLDISRVGNVLASSVYLKARPFANLLAPDPHVGDLGLVPGQQDIPGLVNYSGIGAKDNYNGYGFDTGAFLSDQIELTRWLSLKGGLRWDRWQTSYNALGGNLRLYPDLHFHNVTNVINPSVSLLVTPDEHQTYYFTWGAATTPAGIYVTNTLFPIRPPAGDISAPEHSHLYEIGAKYSLAHDRLGLTAALFRLDKDNAVSTDPSTGLATSTGDEQRNQGLELSATGLILPHWNISATYALYDDETTASLTASNVGRRIPYVAHNQATLWSVYEAFADRPWNLAFGGGVIWRQHVWLDAANTARVPATLDFSGTVSHHFGAHWKIALNGYNLGNRLNYSSLFTNRATPAPGRTFLGQINYSY